MSKDKGIPAHEPNHRSVRAAQGRDGAVQVEASSGILPPAHELERLEAVCPGITKDFFEIARSQIAHRQALELKQSEREDRLVEVFTGEQSGATKLRSTGQWIAASLSVGSIAAGVYCAMIQQPVIGTAIVTTSLAAILGAFVFAKPTSTPTLPTEPSQAP